MNLSLVEMTRRVGMCLLLRREERRKKEERDRRRRQGNTAAQEEEEKNYRLATRHLSANFFPSLLISYCVVFFPEDERREEKKN